MFKRIITTTTPLFRRGFVTNNNDKPWVTTVRGEPKVMDKREFYRGTDVTGDLPPEENNEMSPHSKEMQIKMHHIGNKATEHVSNAQGQKDLAREIHSHDVEERKQERQQEEKEKNLTEFPNKAKQVDSHAVADFERAKASAEKAKLVEDKKKKMEHAREATGEAYTTDVTA